MFTFSTSAASRLQVYFFRACLIAILLLGANQVHADTHCVGTISELRNALVLAANISGSHSVRMRTGVYTLTSPLRYTNDFGGDLSVSGGWNTGCTIRGNDAYETVINANSWGVTFNAKNHLFDQVDVSVELLHFLGPTEITLFGDNIPCGSAQKRLRLSRVVIDNSGTSATNGILIFSECARIEVENSLIIGGARGIEHAYGGAPMRFVNNTIIGSAQNGLLIERLHTGPVAQIELYNNIIYGHGATDVLLIGGNVKAIANTWGELNGGILDPASFDNLTSNPQLNANGRPQEPSSPSINSGRLSIPGGLSNLDIEGNPRLIGSKPDRGAFETLVSDSILILVNNPNDSGAGTLRAALLTANASSGAKGIYFNIPGSCPQSIFLQSPLPLLTTGALLTVDGYSQPGSSANTLDHGNNATLCIQIRKSGSVSALDYAFRVPPASATQLRLYGLAFGGVGDAISLSGGSGHLIQGNRFGDTLFGNNSAVTLFAGSSGNTIGGSASNAYRNTIADSSVAGILNVASNNNEISNNYIGTNSDGVQAAPNATGISISGSAGTRILNNVISGNSGSGIVLIGAATSETTVTSNRIGVMRESNIRPLDLGNGGDGIRIVNTAHDNRIGGTLRDSGNIIATNFGAGIAVVSGARNAATNNQIYGNGGLGIDLDAIGVMPNDDDAASPPLDFANRGLNYPLLNEAIGGEVAGTVRGDFSSTRGGYRIELFINVTCHASGHGEGGFPVGAVDVLIPNMPGQQTIAFSAPIQISTGVLSGWISATATDSSGNTSEFSACQPFIFSNDLFSHGFE